MIQEKKKIELLSPAGNMEKLKTALAFGADAVYVGVPDFSLRVRINDFNLKSIKAAKKYCTENGKKIYATINIFAHNHHFGSLPEHIKALKKIGVDALIISDPGVLSIVKKIWPEVQVHLSTQANCTNYESAKFWQKAGVSRIISGREVTLEEIKEIHSKCPDLELEYFVHGAMCMAYSGRCFLSRDLRGRSANLGDCIQPCRWEYKIKDKKLRSALPEKPMNKIISLPEEEQQFELVEEEHGSYILNSKDLRLIRYLRDLSLAGVCSFKIEGRAKSVYYQAMTAGIYRQALSKIEDLTGEDIVYYEKELESKLVHRGYTTGFLLGDRGDENVSDSHNKCAWEFCGQAVKTKKLNIKNEKNWVLFKVHNTINIGDKIEIVKPFYDIIKLKITALRDPDSGANIKEAHGGQEKMVLLEVNSDIPPYSVIRRKLT